MIVYPGKYYRVRNSLSGQYFVFVVAGNRAGIPERDDILCKIAGQSGDELIVVFSWKFDDWHELSYEETVAYLLEN